MPDAAVTEASIREFHLLGRLMLLDVKMPTRGTRNPAPVDALAGRLAAVGSEGAEVMGAVGAAWAVGGRTL